MRRDAPKDEYEATHKDALNMVRLQPGEGGLLNTLGIVQYRLGLFEEACAVLQRAEKINRVQVPPHGIGEDPLGLALIFTKLGRPAVAEAAIEQFRVLSASRSSTGDEQILLDEYLELRKTATSR